MHWFTYCLMIQFALLVFHALVIPHLEDDDT